MKFFRNLANYFNKPAQLFGPRWSLFMVKEGTPAFALHENSVYRIIGYVMPYFKNGNQPNAPWVLRLTCNAASKSFDLGPEHFTTDGANVTPLMRETIQKIDPAYGVAGQEPTFEELPTHQKIPIPSPSDMLTRWEAMIANPDAVKPRTFYSVISTIFPKTR